MADLFAIGCLSMIIQVALLRELAAASYGIELIYLLGVGVWLVAGAAGAVAGDTRRTPDARGIAFAFLALGAIILPEVAFLRGARRLFGGVPGSYLPLSRQAAVALLGLAPAGALLGWLFRRAAQREIDRGGTPAAAYGWESAGGTAGSVIATGVLYLGWSGLLLAAGTTLAAAAFTSRVRAARWPALGLLAFAAGICWNADRLDLRMTGWNHTGLVASRDTPYGRVTVTSDRGMTALFVNDAFDYDTQGADAEPFAHVPSLQLPTGSRVLVLGGGIAGLLPELLKHGPSRIDLVERDRALHETLMRHLPPETSRQFGLDTVHVAFTDPRRFLGSVGRRYDLVLVATSEPASGGGNRFFTVEFFRLCAARLSPGGVLALRLPSSETIWTPRLLRRNGSVHSALSAVFRDVLVLPGGTDLMLASNGLIVRDPALLSDRLLERRIEARVTTPEYIGWLFTNDRIKEAQRTLSAAKVPPNSDSRPVGHQQTAMLWLGMVLPSGEVPEGALSALAWTTACLAAAGLLGARFRSGWRRMAVATIGGLGGMIAEAVVLLRFQADSGALYGQLGLLLTCFLGGLAAGAFAFGRMAGAREAGRWRGGLLLGGLAAVEVMIAAAGEWGTPAFGLGFSAVVLATAGALSAALFSHASRMPAAGNGPGLSGIYAADLLGGCIGSLLAGIVIIPLFGAGPACLGVALLALAAILVV